MLVRMLENGLSAHHLLKELADFDQIYIDILLGHGQEMIRFW